MGPKDPSGGRTLRQLGRAHARGEIDREQGIPEDGPGKSNGTCWHIIYKHWFRLPDPQNRRLQGMITAIDGSIPFELWR